MRDHSSREAEANGGVRKEEKKLLGSHDIILLGLGLDDEPSPLPDLPPADHEVSCQLSTQSN